MAKKSSKKASFSPLMVLPPVLFLGLALLFIFGMGREDANQLPTAQAGKFAPSVAALTPMDGHAPITDARLKAPTDQGGVKLVNFWASWCGPCRAEHPQLDAMAAEGITIYGVNYKDKADQAANFLSELGNPYAAISADTTGRTAIEYGLYGVPETFVINAEGQITYRFAGPITAEILDQFIRPEMEKAAQ